MIERDGTTTSLWQAKATPYVNQKKQSYRDVYDVIIVGGGITGVTTALKLQRLGMNCLVLEARHLCFGTTGGTTAHLNTLLDTPYTVIEKNFGKENAAQVAASASEAIRLIKSNIKNYSIDCGFKEAAAYLFAQNEKEDKELQDIFDASARAGLELSFEDQMPFPFAFTRALKAAGQAKFNPVDYVYGIANALESQGGDIIQECRVIGSKKDRIIEVETSHGIFKAVNLIYATHIPPGVNLLHLRCVPYRSYAMALRLDQDNYPEDLAYDMLDPYHYYRSQTINGITYLIAGGEDHKTGQEENAANSFAKLEATLRKNFNLREIAHKWSSQYFEPADGLPYIGNLPGHPENIFVATGFGGNGMIYSHVAAALLSDMLLNKENPLMDLFDPNRIKPVAGFVNFVTHNADVVANFAGKLFSAEKMHAFAELAIGEGKIVQYEGAKLGLYKDLQGNLHAVNPVCTHLKCEVKWNNAEQSWDCPCHGARYNYDGAVITGPADLSLEKIDLNAG